MTRAIAQDGAFRENEIMRIAAFLAAVLVVGCAMPARLARAQSCQDDYVTIETIRGTIIDIKLAPEPFKTADIYLSGPTPCDRIWMQVFKTDAARCQVGNAIEVRGVITSDVENNAWQIGSPKN
jgi:hypothetical protein